MRRRFVPVVFGMAALVMGAASAALAPTALTATMGDDCEDDARCAPLNPSEWCQEPVLETFCQYYPDPEQPNDPEEGNCNTWSSGSCPFS